MKCSERLNGETFCLDQLPTAAKPTLGKKRQLNLSVSTKKHPQEEVRNHAQNQRNLHLVIAESTLPINSLHGVSGIHDLPKDLQ